MSLNITENNDDKNRQENEIEVIKSIYNTFEFLIFPHKDKTFIQAQINMAINDSLILEYYENEGAKCEWKTEVTDLPPLWLGLFLPTDYPSHSPPSIELGSEWLTHHEVSFLIKKLDNLWENNSETEILYSWFDYLENSAIQDLFPDNTLKIVDDSLSSGIAKKRLQDSEMNAIKNNFEEVLLVENGELVVHRPNYDKDLHEPRAGDLSNGRPSYLPKYLYEYNYQQKIKKLKNSRHDCLICFENTPGSEIKLIRECRHIFCFNCIKIYVNQLILDGHLRFECPANCKALIKFEEIQDILDKAIKCRWNETNAVWVSIGKKDSNRSLICPRESCQSPLAYLDLNLIFCPKCLVYSCAKCRRVSHGKEPCINHSDIERKKLAREYYNANNTRKQELETRYGPLYLKKIVEEMQTDKWINDNSKPCPHCKMPIQKTEGCNKMVCSYCMTIFCWSCMTIITTKDPYLHFGRKCKIFDFQPDDTIYYF